VDRYVYILVDGLTESTTIIDSIPGARIHNGCRIAFGPDGYLFITTGDFAAVTALSQDRESLAGEILVVVEEVGRFTEDNPFFCPVYSYGNKTPQGLAVDEEVRLWSKEQGPSGQDRLNSIEKGKNYGCPEISGDEIGEPMGTPLIHS